MAEIIVSNLLTPLSDESNFLLSIISQVQQQAQRYRQDYMTAYNVFWNGVIAGHNQQGQPFTAPGQTINPQMVARKLLALGTHAAEYLGYANDLREFVNKHVPENQKVPGPPPGFKFDFSAGDGSVKLQQWVPGDQPDAQGNPTGTWQDVTI